MKPVINHNKIVIISGAGISAESGIPTFQDMGQSLWKNYKAAEVASAEAWRQDPKRVLDFHNKIKVEISAAKPNAAHFALASLEEKYEVVVITQNIDSIHERAGSSHVIHLHGDIRYARSTVDDSLVYDFSHQKLNIGDLCERGSQLRPDVVWFGEDIKLMPVAHQHIATASRVLVVGSALEINPVFEMVEKKVSWHAEKIMVSLVIYNRPKRYRILEGKASLLVPKIVEKWISSDVTI